MRAELDNSQAISMKLNQQYTLAEEECGRLRAAYKWVGGGRSEEESVWMTAQPVSGSLVNSAGIRPCFPPAPPQVSGR